MVNYSRHPASFKDPSGFVFQADDNIYRQVNQFYKANYDQLMSSGLYERLVTKKLLIPHQEKKENLTGSAEWYTTLLPEKLDHISYPYEWCFDQLKDAALLTLTILRTALEYNMVLKDAT